MIDSQIEHITALGAREMKANAIIVTGRRYLGTPYKFDARPGQTRNFDCSSFMQYIFGEHDIELPRVSRQQSMVGRQVSLNNIRKGDLLFFTTSSRRNLTGIQRIGHVGVYIGNNQYLNTVSPPGVTITQLTASRRRAFITARSVIAICDAWHLDELFNGYYYGARQAAGGCNPKEIESFLP